jgi:Fe-S cluster biogenesis protein NfuA
MMFQVAMPTSAVEGVQVSLRTSTQGVVAIKLGGACPHEVEDKASGECRMVD